MYAAIRRYAIDPGSVDEVTRRVRDEFVPVISKAPGFISYDVLVSGANTVTSISYFDDKAGADHSTQIASGWVKDRLSSLLPKPPEVTAGEITLHAEAERGTEKLRPRGSRRRGDLTPSLP